MQLNDDVETNIPNLFLIGAPKSGTTAISNALSQHPSIFVGEKEPRYFDAHVFYDFEEDYPIKDIESYLKVYSGADRSHDYILDASVFNMYSERSIKDILHFSPNAKFIVVLRDPLQAAKSMHLQRLKYVDLKMREISEDFCTCWQTLQARKEGNGYPDGCRNKFLFRYDLLYSYDLYVDFILDFLGRDRVLFLNYDDLKVNYKYIYSKIFEFLDVGYVDVVNKSLNKSEIVKSSFVNRFLTGGADLSRPFRNFIGLKGKNVQYMKNLIQVDKASVKCESCDSEVKKYFGGSYEVMENLGHLYDWPSKGSI